MTQRAWNQCESTAIFVTGLTYEAYEDYYGGAPHADDRRRPTLVALRIYGKLRPRRPHGLVTLAFFKMHMYSLNKFGPDLPSHHGQIKFLETQYNKNLQLK